MNTYKETGYWISVCSRFAYRQWFELNNREYNPIRHEQVIHIGEWLL